MFDLGPHAIFIAMSYAAVAAGICGLLVWVIASERAQQRRLEQLERRGIRRRSTQEQA